MPKLSPTAREVRGALMAYLRPRLAMDSREHCLPMVTRAVEGLTARNYGQQQRRVANSIKRFTQGRLAQDNGISDLIPLLAALAPGVTEADQAPGMGQIATNPGGSAGAMPPAGSTDQPPGVGAPGEMTPAGGNLLELVTRYLTEEGVAPEIINNLPAIVQQGGAPPGGGGDNGESDPAPIAELPPGMVARELAGRGDATIPRRQPGQDDNLDPIEGETMGRSMAVMEPRGGAESDFRTESASDESTEDEMPGEDPRPWEKAEDDEAEDEITPNEQDEQMGGVAAVSAEGTSSRVVNGGAHDNAPVSRKAMDHAIRVAQDAAIRNQRAIRDAERFVRPWVGDLAMDANHPADVYRASLKALGVKGAEKLHPDALRPILEAQPKPGARLMHARQLGDARPRGMAQDSAGVTGSFAERFPDAMKITTMQ